MLDRHEDFSAMTRTPETRNNKINSTLNKTLSKIPERSQILRSFDSGMRSRGPAITKTNRTFRSECFSDNSEEENTPKINHKYTGMKFNQTIKSIRSTKRVKKGVTRKEDHQYLTPDYKLNGATKLK